MTTSNEVTERELLPCPCCGSNQIGGVHDKVYCDSCGLTVTKLRPLANAIAAWNRRTPTVPAIPRTSAEAVLWVESEPSTRLLDLSEVIQGTCHTVMYHISEPRTSNPVWPLYERATPAPADIDNTDNIDIAETLQRAAPADSAAESVEQSRQLWQEAISQAAFYVLNHCKDGEYHAEAISSMPLPTITSKEPDSAAERDAAIADGYECGTMVTDPTGLGAKITLHYIGPAHGDAAFEAIMEIIDAYRAALHTNTGEKA